MGLCLIAETSTLLSVGNTLLNFLYVAIGLGTVIFVHELGHFLVAKACGVKCEKFYIGFDVPIKILGIQLPAAFFRRKWGETEYGIGVIPLGGYVKMLGQDDNPANYEAESERTKIRKKPQDDAVGESEAPASDGADRSAPAAAQPTEDQPRRDDDVPAAASEASIEKPEEEEYEIDPRSFTAKSVPKRMAIIAAGVIMNVIFAVIFATLAYRVGVPYTPCVVGETYPGTVAWEADVNLGDRIIQIGKGGTESQHLRFEMDLLQNIGLTGGKEDLDLLLQDRLKEDKKTWVALRPRPLKAGSDKQPRIGIRAAPSMKLAAIEDMSPVVPHQPAAQTEKPFKRGDEIVAIIVDGNRTDVPDYVALREVLAQHPEEELTVVVKRAVETEGETDPGEKPQTIEVEIKVGTKLMRCVGLVMEMGPIESIQKNSPAEQAGMKVGDVLKSVNGEEVVDPLVIPHMIRPLAGQTITIGVERDGKPVDIKVTPRPPRMYAGYGTSGSLLGIESIGVALPVLNRVRAVLPGSPAAQAGMKQGDELLSAQFVSPNEEQQEEEKKQIGLRHKEIDLEKYRNWLQVHEWMQAIFPGTELKLGYRRSEETKEALLLPKPRSAFGAADDLYVVDRGFRLQARSETHAAESWGEALSLGLRNTWESLMLVFRFLRKLVTNQISPTNLGGPISIFAVAGYEADAGISRLLLFLTLLSANLAIINFLPIPVLDGGHMLFLLYEGIFGKPVNELWAMRLTVAGLVFILSLMVFVIGLDIYRFTSLLLS